MGRTRVWNRGGVEPPGFQGMGTHEQPAWTGGQELAPHRRGLKILGTPLGSPEFVSAHMRGLQEEHSTLLDALQTMPEMQSAWLLLSLCANARANYYLRALPPGLSREFAERHDASLFQTVLRLLDQPAGSEEDMQWARAVAQLPLRAGGLGLRSAVRVAPAAYWASWADCLAMVRAGTRDWRTWSWTRSRVRPESRA
jgi:hypothetical protein